MRLLIRFGFSRQFNADAFSGEDYQTMCGLLKQKYLPNNNQIQTSKEIRLVDQNTNLIGIYSAAEARKKALTLQKDLVLISEQHSTQIVCKISNFRTSILSSFYEEIVTKQNEKILQKAGTTKSLKISITLSENELKLKIKQILEVSKKHLKVRVFMNCKISSREECLSKLEFIKSEVQNRCYIEDQISNKRYEEDEEVVSGKDKEKTETYSFVLKAKDNEFLKTFSDQKDQNPDLKIRTFLKKYYRQEDSDMLDLKGEGNFSLNILEEKAQPKELFTQKDKLKMVKQEPIVDQHVQREAKARLLNKRLKTLLSLI